MQIDITEFPGLCVLRDEEIADKDDAKDKWNNVSKYR